MDVSSGRKNGLRRRIEEVTRQPGGLPLFDQVKAIAGLASEYPHSIRIDARALGGRADNPRYACFEFAFDLVGAPVVHEVKYLTQYSHNIVPGPDYISRLMREKLVEVDAGEARDGTVIIYSDDKGPRHAGLVQGDGVVSKWGAGHRWRHGLLELPAGYGDVVRYFSRPVPTVVINSFIEYALSIDSSLADSIKVVLSH